MKYMLKSLITFLLCLSAAFAGLESPFPSSIPGIDLPNSHYLEVDVIRGMAPMDYLEDLKTLKVTDVLIFKNETKNEVKEEIKLLKDKLELEDENILHIPFRYKDFPSYEEACKQTVRALKYLKDVTEDSQRTVFFHCTVGEDRTGYLAGLWTLLIHGGNARQVFENEMCTRGYGRGNPQKPEVVYKAIRKELTPLYFKMAKLIQTRRINLRKLDEKVCNGITISSSGIPPYCKPQPIPKKSRTREVQKRIDWREKARGQRH
ncbi:MAG: tyrosine-protein phosphatase [Halobacteriovoraceae bacterium]|nr:tyrosine-protein phosphatase [Halobacteriovoraceae bacterium]MCB9095238.1 tyrosine-protein phosphatase [Halobacteriovoraceae bacterium]